MRLNEVQKATRFLQPASEIALLSNQVNKKCVHALLITSAAMFCCCHARCADNALYVEPTKTSSPSQSHAKNLETSVGTRELTIEDSRHSRLRISEYDANLREHPKSANAFYIRGDYFERAFEPERAIADFTQAIRLNPKLHAAYLGRGKAFCEIEDYKKALPDLRFATNGDPSTAKEALKQCGEVCTSLGLHSEAADCYERLFKLAPSKDTRAKIAYADCLIKANRLNEALKVTNEALSHNKLSWQALCGRGRVYLKMKDYAKAEADYNAAVQTSPDNADIYLERAALYDQMGNKVRADRDRKFARMYQKQSVKDAPFRMP